MLTYSLFLLTCCCVSAESGAAMDKRSLALAGEPSWIRGGLQVFTHLSVLTAHDMMNVSSRAGDYIFANLFPVSPDKEDCLYTLLKVMQECQHLTSTVHTDNREDVDRLKLAVIEALCKCEAFLPRTEMSVMFHILVHVPDCMYRWNSARNFWSACCVSTLYSFQHFLCYVSRLYLL